MAIDISERPGAEEIYERATNATNLKQEPERRTSADVLRDMAMSATRLGGSLMRLRSQWAGSTRPERQLPRTVKEFQALLGDKEKAITAHYEERARCDASYDSALAALSARLPELDLVREQLTPIAIKWGMGKPQDPSARSERREQDEDDDKTLATLRENLESATDEGGKAEAQALVNDWIIKVGQRHDREAQEDRQRAQAKIGAVIRYWLSQVCPKCDGRKFQVLPGTARLSTKTCLPESQGGCGGSGFVSVPHQQEGRRLANHMDSCVQRYRQLSGARKAVSNLSLRDRIPMAMRHGENPKTGPDPDAD